MADETPKETVWGRFFRSKKETKPAVELSGEKIAKITQEAVEALEDERPQPVGLIGSGPNVDLVAGAIEAALRGKQFEVLAIGIQEGMSGIGIVESAAHTLGVKRKEGQMSGTNPPAEIAELLKGTPKRTLVVFKGCENFGPGRHINLARQIRAIYNELAFNERDAEAMMLRNISFMTVGSADPNDTNNWGKGDAGTFDNVTRYLRL